jgi:hypothetical protein
MAERADPVRRAFKFRAYPTRPQEHRAVRLLADHCDLYNAALEERREAWRMRRASVSYGLQSAQLKDIRRADPHGQGRHSFTAQQQTLRRLNTVFTAFYSRAGKREKAGYPRFKAYRRFTKSGSSQGTARNGPPLPLAIGRGQRSRLSARSRSTSTGRSPGRSSSCSSNGNIAAGTPS